MRDFPCTIIVLTLTGIGALVNLFALYTSCFSHECWLKQAQERSRTRCEMRVSEGMSKEVKYSETFGCLVRNSENDAWQIAR